MIQRIDHHRITRRAVDADVTPAEALVTFALQPGCVMLESVCDTSGYGRYSVLTANPISQADPIGAASDPLGFLASLPLAEASYSPYPIAPGWFGYFPYELGAKMQQIAQRNAPTDPRFRLYDTIALFDHDTNQWRVIAADFPRSRTPSSERLSRFEELLFQSRRRIIRSKDDDSANAGLSASLVDRSMDRDCYLDRVRRAQAHIAAGDIYQVNLTQRFTFSRLMSPVQLYQRLRCANPASFAAYVDDAGRKVLSSSPELFLQCDGRRVITRPIKGTIPRPSDLTDDSAAAAQLSNCEKNRAELNMIIDLMRNDLGRVCRPGTIRVVHDGEIETHPTVLHRVATIQGDLNHDATAADLIRAAFPGGSVTGCPKIRAMQIIRQLEPTARDVYCGSIGCIDMFGRVNLNIAIRTMLCDDDRVHVYAGGAITADSNPVDEYDECIAKAAGMLRALGVRIDDLDPPVVMAKESTV